MRIENSNMNDIEEIFRLYRVARSYMEARNSVCWPEFDRKMVEQEVRDLHQWKMTEGTTITCVWATTFTDPLIWEEKDRDPSVYIHRIATNPDYRGNNLVTKIVDWSREFARKNQKEFVRLDTVGENLGLISHYQKCGFDFLGLFKLKHTAGLPAHYDNASVSLFQLPVEKPILIENDLKK